MTKPGLNNHQWEYRVAPWPLSPVWHCAGCGWNEQYETFPQGPGFMFGGGCNRTVSAAPAYAFEPD